PVAAPTAAAALRRTAFNGAAIPPASARHRASLDLGGGTWPGRPFRGPNRSPSSLGLLEPTLGSCGSTGKTTPHRTSPLCAEEVNPSNRWCPHLFQHDTVVAAVKDGL